MLISHLQMNSNIFVDVRETPERDDGFIPHSIHLPKSFLELKAEEKLPDKTASIVCYCQSGKRSEFAAKSLRNIGFKNATSLEGGFLQWKKSGKPIEKPKLTAKESQFYLGHINIPQVGEPGQFRLKSAKVLLIGAGGLGSPAAYYLAAAGIGTLGIMDYDRVEISNLHRQILHNTEDLGRLKVDSAKEKLSKLNPWIEIPTYPKKLTQTNAKQLFEKYDLIVDGSDNFPTRYLINDTCILLKKPFVHGSIHQFEGMVTLFNPGQGPCYRCLHPQPPAKEDSPSCSEAGVFGLLPGIIGQLEASEAVNFFLNQGVSLQGRLLYYNALKQTFTEIKLRKDPHCPH